MTDFSTSGFLAESDNQSIELAPPKTIQQADMLEALESLSPQQCTELVTDWYLFWVTFHTQLAMGVE